MRTAAPNAPATLRALRVTAVLTVASLAWQFVTAGQLFGDDGGPVGLHAGGAIVLHVLSGLTAIAALLHLRRSRGPAWPSVLAAVVFALTFLQAADGGLETLWVHVPGAMVLTGGTVWLAAWSMSSAAAPGTIPS